MNVGLPFTPPIIKRLTSYIKETSSDDVAVDPEWIDKAVRSLVKKLKRNGQISELEKALSTQGCQRTMCVYIPRSLDGRLQIAHRKGLPHVIYCRLFRWPGLQTHHELRALDCCEFAFHLKKDDVCVNPFHYERVEAPTLPPVIIQRGAQNDLDPKSGMPGDYKVRTAMGIAMEETEVPDNQSTTYPADLVSSCYSPAGSAVSSSYAGSIPPETPPPGYAPDEDLKSPVSVQGSTAGLSPGSPFRGNEVATSGARDAYGAGYDGGSPMYSTSGQAESMSAGSPQPSLFSEDDRTRIHYQDRPHWCEIRYYELSQRVGDDILFAATIPSITVCGFADETTKDRFCLGLVPNPHRVLDAESVRKHIKRGVRLTYIGGEVFAECVSDSPIFIQSAACNARYKWNRSTVCKVPPGCHLKIFNNEEFAAALRIAVDKSVVAVHDLLRLVNIRISFIKGWGVNYSRKKVTQSPCWIEIQLTGPLHWLDNVMRTMGSLGPGSSCS